MNTYREKRGTVMNWQRIPNTMILGIAGIFLLLLGAFPRVLWASQGDRLQIKGTFGDLSFVSINQLQGRHHPPIEQHRYRGMDRYERRPVVTTTTSTYRDHRRTAPHWGYNSPRYHRPSLRGRSHQRRNHYYRNRHRHPQADHYDRNRRTR